MERGLDSAFRKLQNTFKIQYMIEYHVYALFRSIAIKHQASKVAFSSIVGHITATG